MGERLTNAFGGIVFRSERLRSVLERAAAAAQSSAPVLVIGETGTGKELLAWAIHAASPRSNRMFVPVNAAALPRELVESELFGYRRGAFSGAERDHVGLFESAHHGTLFLDEVGDLALDAQAKLLRALDHGEIRPVGAVDRRVLDVRVIAATNRSLWELRGGILRSDLFFRLAVFVIELPPLRERKADIPDLLHHFLARYRAAGVTRVQAVDDDALALVKSYAFPGNVRELENLVEALAIVTPRDRTTIGRHDVEAWFSRHGIELDDAAPGEQTCSLKELESQAIRTALSRAHGNKTRAAQLLGISRERLYAKLQTLAQSASKDAKTRAAKGERSTWSRSSGHSIRHDAVAASAPVV